MAGGAGAASAIWIVAETNADGSLAKSSTEVATLARTLAEAAGTTAAGIVVAADPSAAAKELAGFVGRVVAVATPDVAGHTWAQAAAQQAADILASETPAAVLTGAGPDGRDVAGTLAALLERPILVNATAVAWAGGPSVEMNVFGGKLVTTSAFTDAEWGIVTVRPNVVTAEPAASAGSIENRAPVAGAGLPAVKVVEQGTIESVSKLESLLKLYGELHRLSRKACTIDVMSRIPGQAFFEDYYCTNRPVVLKGLLEGSKALKKWSPEFFAKNFGPTLIQVTANRNSDPDYERNFRQSVQTMTMAEFVTRLSREVESNDFYLVARNFFFENPAFKTLRSDLEPPSEIIDLTDKSPGSIKLWFGPKGTVTPLHHDEHSILFVQVYGKKHFKLIPSFDLPHVYRSNNYYSSVDPENVDIERQAKFLSASVVDVIVEPGDVLFIPVGWWHWVKALDISISATFCSFNVKNRNTVWKPT
jgi:hypothetical protein